ncbi:DUF4405 domain-containing protein [uncultured Methanospirillum sp.]|uniref:DUF4405 domain-containing protein n=1 Tax=uncultured Methanospirillum sp. TaxID=262503 RepID=UPI003747B001
MKKRVFIRITTVLLLMTTIVSVITGIIKWPGFISTFGLSYRHIPLALITDIHDWSGLCMIIFCSIHVFQFRRAVKRMILKLFTTD